MSLQVNNNSLGKNPFAVLAAPDKKSKKKDSTSHHVAKPAVEDTAAKTERFVEPARVTSDDEGWTVVGKKGKPSKFVPKQVANPYSKGLEIQVKGRLPPKRISSMLVGKEQKEQIYSNPDAPLNLTTTGKHIKETITIYPHQFPSGKKEAKTEGGTIDQTDVFGTFVIKDTDESQSDQGYESGTVLIHDLKETAQEPSPETTENTEAKKPTTKVAPNIPVMKAASKKRGSIFSNLIARISKIFRSAVSGLQKIPSMFGNIFASIIPTSKKKANHQPQDTKGLIKA